MQLTIPSDFPAPKFAFGQEVETTRETQKFDRRRIKGRIVGMEYTSRDAALAEGSVPEWSYTVETPAFEEPEPHHVYSEEYLQPLEAEVSEVAA